MAEFQLNFLSFPILAFVCWVGLLLLSLCYLKGNSSFSIFWKQGDIDQVSKPESLKDIKSFFSNGCIQCYQFPSRYCFFCISQILTSCILIFILLKIFLFSEISSLTHLLVACCLLFKHFGILAFLTICKRFPV